jgi:hypothetical protein
VERRPRHCHTDRGPCGVVERHRLDFTEFARAGAEHIQAAEHCGGEHHAHSNFLRNGRGVEFWFWKPDPNAKRTDDHSTALWLIDKRGELRIRYKDNQPDVPRLLREIATV